MPCEHLTLTWVGKSGVDDLYRCNQCGIIRMLRQFERMWRDAWMDAQRRLTAVRG